MMRKKLWMFSFLSLTLLLGVMAVNTLSAFVQCPGNLAACGAAQGTTEESDLINGTEDVDSFIQGLGGDDVIFGRGNPDFIVGGEGNDLVFGGSGSDDINGNEGNDILLPGSDDEWEQEVDGEGGNDSFHVFVGEITTCLSIFGREGSDTANLIGFGSYSATTPFGIENLESGAILVIDPITGGRIFIYVSDDSANHTETINGLLTPNVTFLTDAELTTLFGTDPCPGEFGF
jgi:hypothetical protein